MGDKLEPLASEMYRDLQNTNRFLRRLLLGMLGVIAVLVIALAATNIYHIHQWSQFDICPSPLWTGVSAASSGKYIRCYKCFDAFLTEKRGNLDGFPLFFYAKI